VGAGAAVEVVVACVVVVSVVAGSVAVVVASVVVVAGVVADATVFVEPCVVALAARTPKTAVAAAAVQATTAVRRETRRTPSSRFWISGSRLLMPTIRAAAPKSQLRVLLRRR
jgi:hypothetical protein